MPIVIALFSSFAFLGTKPTSEGYYITNNGDTSRVAFYIKINLIGGGLNDVGMQGYIKFIDKAGGKGKIIPDEVKEYAFEYLNKKYVYQTVKMTWNPYFPSNTFLRLEIEGKCKLYTYFQHEQRSHMLVNDPVVQKNKSNPYLLVDNLAGKFISNQLNQGTLNEYFSDCPQLCKKLNEKEFSRSKPDEIVEFYNLNCSQ